MIDIALVQRAQRTGGFFLALALALALAPAAGVAQPFRPLVPGSEHEPTQPPADEAAPSSEAAPALEPIPTLPESQASPSSPEPEPAAPAPAAPPGEEELIVDPELGGIAAGGPREAGRADEAIHDPELDKAAPAASSTATGEPNGQVRLVLRSRVGVDTAWQDPREDVFEATQIALFEARVRRSDRLRFEVGLRARYLFASREHSSPDQGAGRYEFDVAPTAAYADGKLADGLHARIGYQSVRLGRFDVLNPSDILSVYDLRSGLATLPEANEIAQPALRVDWDLASFLSLGVFVLPFFQPHVVRAFDGDYALSRSRDADVNALYGAFADPTAIATAQALVRNTLSRTGQGQFADGAFSAFAPRPNWKNPQAALHLLAHGGAGELGFTAGTAFEHLPALVFSDAFVKNAKLLTAAVAACDNDPTSAKCIDGVGNLANLAPDLHPIDVRYDRFELLSLDGDLPLGPLQLGAELAYMFGRTQFAPPTAQQAAMGEIAQPVHTDIAHAGLRLEWVHGESLVIALEATAERAIKLPSDNSRYLFMTADGFLLSALVFASIAPFEELGLTLELGGGVLNGPTYMLAPRADQRLFDRFYMELGACLLTGKRYPIADPRVTLGGLYSDTNQVFVGVRWLP